MDELGGMMHTQAIPVQGWRAIYAFPWKAASRPIVAVTFAAPLSCFLPLVRRDDGVLVEPQALQGFVTILHESESDSAPDVEARRQAVAKRCELEAEVVSLAERAAAAAEKARIANDEAVSAKKAARDADDEHKAAAKKHAEDLSAKAKDLSAAAEDLVLQSTAAAAKLAEATAAKDPSLMRQSTAVAAKEKSGEPTEHEGGA